MCVLQVIMALLKAKADINQCMDSGDGPYYTCVSLCAQRNKGSILRLLLEEKADIELTGHPNDVRPLHYACMNGATDAAIALIDGGAQLDVVKADGFTPLLLACSNGAPTIVAHLLKAHCSPNLTKEKGMHTPLMFAVMQRSQEMTKLLLDAGAKTGARDAMGKTALHHAAEGRGSLEVVKLLLAANAKVDEEIVGEAVDEASKALLQEALDAK